MFGELDKMLGTKGGPLKGQYRVTLGESDILAMQLVTPKSLFPDDQAGVTSLLFK